MNMIANAAIVLGLILLFGSGLGALLAYVDWRLDNADRKVAQADEGEGAGGDEHT